MRIYPRHEVLSVCWDLQHVLTGHAWGDRNWPNMFRWSQWSTGADTKRQLPQSGPDNDTGRKYILARCTHTTENQGKSASDYSRHKGPKFHLLGLLRSPDPEEHAARLFAVNSSQFSLPSHPSFPSFPSFLRPTDWGPLHRRQFVEFLEPLLNGRQMRWWGFRGESIGWLAYWWVFLTIVQQIQCLV